MLNRKHVVAIAVAGVLLVAAPLGALAQDEAASDTKVASVAGGPHPFFDPWGPGTEAAVADFGLAGGTYEFPPAWELTAQNDLVETLAAQGYNAFTIFPGDANATNTLMDELKAARHPQRVRWWLHHRAVPGRVLPGHGRRQLGVHRHEDPHRGHG